MSRLWRDPSTEPALVGVYLVSGIVKLFDFPATVIEQEQLGLYPGAFWAALAIAD